jgi:uncharacterized protein
VNSKRMFGDINLFVIFTTGLLVGGISCLAVQGGLLASTLATLEQEKLVKRTQASNLLPVVAFLIAKLIAYTLLGALLGWFGSLVQLSPLAHLILQFAVVVFMVGTALNLLDVHPIFRYFVIQPPRFLTRLVRQQSKRQDIFAPAVLGIFTVFIPCGATQAMMALAIASGSPLAGSVILFTFVLGTSPLFLILGYFAMRVGDILKQRFTKFAAVVLLVIAFFNLNGALTLTGTQYTLTNLISKVFCLVSYCPQDLYGAPVTDQTIMITPTGYSPSTFSVVAGSEVTVRLVNQGAFGCQQTFVIPSLSLQKIVAPNRAETFTFIAPEQPGNLAFMCSMGMYPGVIRVL